MSKKVISYCDYCEKYIDISGENIGDAEKNECAVVSGSICPACYREQLVINGESPEEIKALVDSAKRERKLKLEEEEKKRPYVEPNLDQYNHLTVDEKDKWNKFWFRIR